MKLTIEGSTVEIQKVLQAMAGSQEHVDTLTLEASNELLTKAVEKLNEANQKYRQALTVS